MSPISIYQDLHKKHASSFQKSNKKFQLFGSIRLLLILLTITLGYAYIKFEQPLFLVGVLVAFILFIICYKIHQKISIIRNLEKEIVKINATEINYLEEKKLPFENGKEFIDPNHFYSFDLDLFGEKSLFQHLNRTITFIGKKQLAEDLQNLFEASTILDRQETINELAQKIDWRQNFSAHHSNFKNGQKDDQKIYDWIETKDKSLSKFVVFGSYFLPIVFLAIVFGYFFSHSENYYKIIIYAFIFNVVFFFSQFKKIKEITEFSDEIDQILKQYSLLIQQIENENFSSKLGQELKNNFKTNGQKASLSIQKISALFADLNNTHNPLGAILINGVSLYHLHVLRKTYIWKKTHQSNVKNWLNTLAQFDALNSLANYTFNSPHFIFPNINQNYNIDILQVGHPLIEENKRICNDISFTHNPFNLLTGSNMAGKSTFLRTLGINMVLTGIGAPICAQKANIHPLQVIVSMRQTDSLAENESYFFAEVKRLKQIITYLQTNRSFVLLDEILKGTNSDDKKAGTIGVIKKILALKSIGMIATHDIEVCKITDEFPDYLVNRCFEVQIVSDELYFDYKLKEGICKNKSATFLMEKMEII